MPRGEKKVHHISILTQISLKEKKKKFSESIIFYELSKSELVAS